MSSLNDNGFVKHFEFKEFTELKEIGKGASGFVIKGNYKKGGQIVALKCVQHRNRKSSLIEKEMRSLQELSYHKNVISFLGVSIDHENERYFLVLEYCENGNLREYLRKYEYQLNWPKKITMCRDIAHGLRCIHNEGITHRDLHSKNILIHQDSRLIIADFGLSAQLLNEAEATSSSVCGMLPYIDPQVLNSRYRPKMESDIYSFGMLIWEISTCRVPPFVTIDKLYKMLTSDTPPIISEIIIRCLECLPENRPKIQELVEIFDNLYNANNISSPSSPRPILIYTPVIDSPISSPGSNSLYRTAPDNDSNTNTSELSDSPFTNNLNNLLNRESYIVHPPPLPPKPPKINTDLYPPPPPIPPKPNRNTLYGFQTPSRQELRAPSLQELRTLSQHEFQQSPQQELLRSPQQALLTPPRSPLPRHGYDAYYSTNMANMENIFCEGEDKLTIKEIEGTLLELKARYGKPDVVKESFQRSLEYEDNISHFLHLIISNDNFQGKKEFKSIISWLFDFGFLGKMINELAPLEPLSSLEPLSPKVSPLFALSCVRNSINQNHVQYLLQNEADPTLLSKPYELSVLNLVLLRMINEQEDHSSIIEELLDHDADANVPLDINNLQYDRYFIKSKQHKTSLCPKVPNSLYLSLYLPDRYRKKVIGLLIDKVAITQVDHEGINVLEYAVKEKLYSGIIDLLKEVEEKLHKRVARQLVQIEPREDIYQNIIANANLPIKTSKHWDDLPNSLFACVHMERMEPNNFAYLIKILIENKANYDMKYRDFNVLHYSLIIHKFEAFKNIVKAIPKNDECLSQGIHWVQKKNYTLTPLNRFLLEITQCNLGMTPLAIETVKLLLEKGANADLFVKSAKDDHDKEIFPDFSNTLFLAIYLQDKIDRDIILLLIYLGKINFTTKTITTITAFKNLNILQYAIALRENIELLKVLMENVVEFNKQPLFKSAEKTSNTKVRNWLRDHKKNSDIFIVENQERITKNRLGITV
ncbi:8329_t:CDS:2 [Diversispora eburnea]|uniref:non-specific serine/threonine protein kinase n=1 Tax=Diversispora eburnea TaxID=1213867 RepID=A0A9N9F780_9GLOM|nr:8329_t:CDS:2 [Diversispora eburnea]